MDDSGLKLADVTGPSKQLKREEAAQTLASKTLAHNDSKALISELKSQLNHKTVELDEKVRILEEEKHLSDHKFEQMQRQCKEAIHGQYEHVIKRLQLQLTTVLSHSHQLANERAELLANNHSQSTEYEIFSNSMKHKLRSLETLHQNAKSVSKTQIGTLNEKLSSCNCAELKLQNERLDEMMRTLTEDFKIGSRDSKDQLKSLEMKLRESNEINETLKVKVENLEKSFKIEQKHSRMLEKQAEDERSRMVDLKSALANQELDQRKEAQIFEEKYSKAKFEYHEDLMKLQILLDVSIKRNTELDTEHTKFRQQASEEETCPKCAERKQSDEKNLRKTSATDGFTLENHQNVAALETCQQEISEQKDLLNSCRRQLNEQKQGNAHLERLMRVTQRQCKRMKQSMEINSRDQDGARKVAVAEPTTISKMPCDLTQYTNEINELEQRLEKISMKHQMTLSSHIMI